MEFCCTVIFIFFTQLLKFNYESYKELIFKAIQLYFINLLQSLLPPLPPPPPLPLTLSQGVSPIFDLRRPIAQLPKQGESSSTI